MRRVTGALKWIEKVKPRLTSFVHRLSCMMAYPPIEQQAAQVAETLAWWAWEERFDGITFGGEPDADLTNLHGALAVDPQMADGAPARLQVAADATWQGAPAALPDVYGLLLTLNRGAIVHTTKLAGLILDSSMEQEAHASSRGAEANAYAREIMRAHGLPLARPTEILTDNLASEQVASGKAYSSRSRHFLRRYYALMQRIERGEAVMVKVSDEQNPADFLTKYAPMKKLRMSVDYAENTRNSVTRARTSEPTSAADAATASRADADGFVTVGRNGRLRQRVRVR